MSLLTPSQTAHDSLAEELGVQYYHRPVLYTPGGVPSKPLNSDRSPYNKNWWTEQFRRLSVGWTCPDTGVYINPYYYGHMNFLEFDIENDLEETSGLQAPLYRDNDHLVFDEFYYNLSGYRHRAGKKYFKSCHNIVVAKGRRMAWTTNFQGFQIFHFVLNQHRHIAKLYASDDKLITENLAMRSLYHKLHPMLKYHTKTRKPMYLIKESQEMLVQGYYHGKKKVEVNRMHFFVTSKNPGAARGDKYGVVEIVEAGVHTNLEKVMYAMFDTVGQGAQQFGFIGVGGTSDKIVNDTEDYKNIFEHPKTYSARRLFLPSYRVRLGFFNARTGVSDEAGAMNDIQKNRKEKSENPNPNVLLSYTQENPVSWEECFIPPSRNEYDRVKLDAQLSFIMTNLKPEDYLTGYLEEVNDIYGRPTGSYTLRRDPLGPWKVHKDGLPHPGEQENAYVFGIDDFYKDLTKDPTSKGAICVYRLPTLQKQPFPTDYPCAIYERRPKRTAFHDECVLAMKVWPGMVNYEYNDDVFFKRLEEEFMMNRIISWDGTRPGMTVKTNEIALMTAAVNKILAEDIQKYIFFMAIIEGIKKWQSLNTDIGSAYHLCIAARERLTKVLKQTREQEQPDYKPVSITGFPDTYQGFGPSLVGVGEDDLDWGGWMPGI